MRSGLRSRAIPLGLAGLALLLALVQKPGQISFDTKVHLHLEPVRFLADVISAWSNTADLGHVQSSQYSGYLFPMGPFFALGHDLGLADWLVDRLWLAALLALSAWGAVRLLDALWERPRGLAHLVAGAVFMLNPYVVTFADRTSVTLLAYAALPWMLLAVHRGLRHPRSWWWPAAFALVAMASGGGVNAAVIAWTLVGPLLLLLYEPLFAGIEWRAVRAFAWRTALASLLASLWWIAPVLIGNSYGVNFLQFIEQPGTIWGTTSISEAFRLMGYWISYAGVGFAGKPLPELDSAATLLFTRPVVIASLLVPALALTGFVWTRRWRYGPLFLALVLAGVVIVVAGFPEGTPFREGLYFLYNRVSAVQFLRTSYKGAPLIAIGLAVLLGTGVAEAWARLKARPRLLTGVLALALAGVIVGASWPLFSGQAVGLTTSSGVPAAWRQAASDLDRQLPPNSRAMVLPGQLFSFYTWGGTVDPILPVLAKVPVAQRSITPYSDLHADDLLFTIDSLVEQQRLYPGQLGPLLSLIGVRAVVTGSDDDRLRSGSVDQTIAATELAGQGLSRPARSYGPLRTFPAPPSELYAPMTLPEVRRYDLPSSRGIVRVEPAGQPTIVDGSADALAGLAAFGALPSHDPIFYAGDLSAAQLQADANTGANIVISDSNRRQVHVNSSVDQNLGPTIGAQDSFSRDASVLDPFAGAGSVAQTVQVLSGVSYIRAPYSPQLALFPEHAPYAAFDGSPATAWIADRALAPSRRSITVGFLAPRDVPYIDLLPEDDSRGTVEAVEVAGRRFAAHPGWNRLTLDLHHVDSLTVLIAKVKIPLTVSGGAGGLSEVSIPGLHVGEALRVPQLAQQALAGRDLSHDSLTYLFSRTTGDDPLQRNLQHGPWQAESLRDVGDGETGLSRVIAPPAARSWSADAWLSLSPAAPDDELDRLAGYRGPVQATSSSRFDDEGRYRASSAFDGVPGDAWVADHEANSKAWIAWSLPRAVTVSRLRLVAPKLPVRIPARIELSWPGGASGALPVAPDGTISLPAPARASRFRLTILATRLAPGAPREALIRRAVGIGKILGAGVPVMHIPRNGPIHAPCGIASFQVGGHDVSLALVHDDVSALDDAGALRARQCSKPVPLTAASQTLTASGAGTFRIDWLRLVSPAPAGLPAPGAGGQLLSAGHLGSTSVTGVRVALHGPSWLVLGESYDRGWRADCDGHSLGTPVVVDGFANGWRAPPGCRDVSFSFAPQKPLDVIYVLSGLVALALLALLVLTRRPAVATETTETTATPLPTVDRPAPWSARRAAAAGLAASVALGFLFSIRAGVVIAPVTALVLWRGIGPRALIVSAGALLGVVVPILYLTIHHKNHGGFDFNYAVDLIDAHWVAVAAFVLLTFALVRTLAAQRSAGAS